MAKHTPGPWFVETSPNTSGQFSVGADTCLSEIAQGDSYYQRLEAICFLDAILTPAGGGHPATYRIEPTKLANTHLIAAAPDRWAKPRQTDADPYHPANVLMCAAIAKATGAK